MKYQRLFSREKKRKNIITLSSAEFALSTVLNRVKQFSGKSSKLLLYEGGSC